MLSYVFTTNIGFGNHLSQVTTMAPNYMGILSVIFCSLQWRNNLGHSTYKGHVWNLSADKLQKKSTKLSVIIQHDPVSLIAMYNWQKNVPCNLTLTHCNTFIVWTKYVKLKVWYGKMDKTQPQTAITFNLLFQPTLKAPHARMGNW